MEIALKIREAVCMLISYGDRPVSIKLHPSVMVQLRAEREDQGYGNLNTIMGYPVEEVHMLYKGRGVHAEVSGKHNFVLLVDGE